MLINRDSANPFNAGAYIRAGSRHPHFKPLSPIVYTCRFSATQLYPLAPGAYTTGSRHPHFNPLSGGACACRFKTVGGARLTVLLDEEGESVVVWERTGQQDSTQWQRVHLSLTVPTDYQVTPLTAR